jgi:transposase
MANNNRRAIRERRERILLLLSRGYGQSDIANELGVTRQTINSDMKFINETTKRGLFGLAKETLSTMYQNCIESINEIQRECWKRYHTSPEDNPALNEWHKHSALELLRKCSESKFGMFQAAPALMEINKLNTELLKLKEEQEQQLNYNYRNYRVNTFNKDIDNGRLPFKDLDKP